MSEGKNGLVAAQKYEPADRSSWQVDVAFESRLLEIRDEYLHADVPATGDGQRDAVDPPRTIGLMHRIALQRLRTHRGTRQCQSHFTAHRHAGIGADNGQARAQRRSACADNTISTIALCGADGSALCSSACGRRREAVV